MSILTRGAVTLENPHSWLLDAGGLDDEDIAAAALMIVRVVGPFPAVEAVDPRSQRLADACNLHRAGRGPTLIVAVDSTTPDAFETQRGDRDPTSVVGMTVFNLGNLPRWCQQLFQLHSALRI